MLEQILQQLQSAIMNSANNDFFNGGILLGMLGSMAYYLKAVPLWIWSRVRRQIFYSLTIDNTDKTTYESFSIWYKEKYPGQFRNIGLQTKVNHEEKDAKKKFKFIKINISDIQIIKYNGWYIWVTKSREKVAVMEGMSELFLHSYKITTFFGRSVLQKLEEELLNYTIEMEESNDFTKVYTRGGYQGWSRKNLSVFKTMDNIFFPEKEEYIKYLEKYEDNKNRYMELGIKPKRGILLYGSPGGGKTTLAIATANHFDRDIYIINLNSVGDTSLISAVNDMPPKSVLLFEDIDCLFDNKAEETDSIDGVKEFTASNDRNVKNNKALSFSTILNVLDGIYSPHDVIVIMTTNKPEVLEKAMIRTGRIDKKYLIDKPTAVEVNQFMSKFYGHECFLKYDGSMSMSDIQEICLSSKDLNEASNRIINNRI